MLALLVTIFYANFALPLGLSERQVLSAAALAALGSALIPVRRESPDPAGVIRRGLPLPVLLAPLPVVALALVLVSPGSAVTAEPGPVPSSVEVMTYNSHQGFDLEGDLDPEALARVIEASGADIVGLQEVSRGWLVNGSLDLHEWLRRRLGMEARFAPTAGGQWGNALFSRFPITRFENRPLPPPSLPLQRGVFDAEVAVGEHRLRILGTHLFHRGWGTDIRQQQVAALLELWDGSPSTLLLGDLNALPESPEMSSLATAGLQDAADLLPPRRRGTFPSSQIGSHLIQIDYIWTSPDLRLQRTSVLESTASDHLPVVTTVLLGANP